MRSTRSIVMPAGCCGAEGNYPSPAACKGCIYHSAASRWFDGAARESILPHGVTSIEDSSLIDEAGNRDVSDVHHPDLVWVIDDPAAGEVREDRAVVVAVGRGHEPQEPADLLGIDNYAAMALFGADPATAIGFELIADPDHRRRDQRGIGA